MLDYCAKDIDQAVRSTSAGEDDNITPRHSAEALHDMNGPVFIFLNNSPDALIGFLWCAQCRT